MLSAARDASNHHVPRIAPRAARQPAIAGPRQLRPGVREFYGGLAVLTVCGAIAMMRGGPESSLAASPGDSRATSAAHAAEAPAPTSWQAARQRALDADAKKKTRSE